MANAKDLELHPFSELMLILLVFVVLLMIADLAVNHSRPCNHKKIVRSGMRNRIVFITLVAWGVGARYNEWTGTLHVWGLMVFEALILLGWNKMDQLLKLHVTSLVPPDYGYEARFRNQKFILPSMTPFASVISLRVVPVQLSF
ncbi:hypothetical protein B0O99DRAFT_589039 [Bisporella sp. PMI_857]|nr:hypothetical protein B0O99DRAFT_589039 [Bisporella sp. PMI_857]